MAALCPYQDTFSSHYEWNFYFSLAVHIHVWGLPSEDGEMLSLTSFEEDFCQRGAIGLTSITPSYESFLNIFSSCATLEDEFLDVLDRKGCRGIWARVSCRWRYRNPKTCCKTLETTSSAWLCLLYMFFWADLSKCIVRTGPPSLASAVCLRCVDQLPPLWLATGPLRERTPSNCLLPCLAYLLDTLCSCWLSAPSPSSMAKSGAARTSCTI